MEKAFDTRRLNQFENNLRTMVDTEYDVCLHQCNTRKSDYGTCKQNCFRNVMVPYHILKHAAQEDEETDYKLCLADKLPNIKREDYVACTNNIYSTRATLLMTHLHKSAQNILERIH